jgi:hypothetical protein
MRVQVGVKELQTKFHQVLKIHSLSCTFTAIPYLLLAITTPTIAHTIMSSASYEQKLKAAYDLLESDLKECIRLAKINLR